MVVSVGTADPLPPLTLPATTNYIGVFLSLRCNLRCSYCINRFGGYRAGELLFAGSDWLRGLNRIATRPDLPISLQGGEPSTHPDFYQILEGLRPDIPVDLLTNLQFDVDEFMDRVPASRLRRDSPYASIRVSYHPGQMDLGLLQKKVLKMLSRGYSIGIWAVNHPASEAEIAAAQASSQALGIDFRLKEFLGMHQGKLFGRYKYPQAVQSAHKRHVTCRTTELLVGPGGDVFRCHSDLYAGRGAYGHLLDSGFRYSDTFRPCDVYGECNPCDIKIKTNRFQEFGHTSVEIRFA